MSDHKKGTAPRIAIKFGAQSSNNNAKKTSSPNPPSTLGKRPRSNAWSAGSDSEPDEDEKRGRHEKITGFGEDGAETERKIKDAKTEKKEYIIPRQPNRDWRIDAKAQRGGKNLLPAEARAQQNGDNVETEPVGQDKGIKWGLTVQNKPEKDDHEESETTQDPTPDDDPKQDPPPKRTADDEAMDALLGNKPEGQKIIHSTEEDAFRHDIEQAGEMPTVEDYEAMPVEEFGAALLRGMGWDGKPRGTKVKEVKRRPNRLGLGAKELKEDEDLGAWNQGGKNRRPRLNEYRREEDKRKEARRNEDSYKRERERERERDRGFDRDRHGHRDRDRERNRDRDYDRQRDQRRGYDRDRRR